MRFHVGPIPRNPNFNPEDSGWSPIREPKPWVLMAIATPVGIVTAVLMAYLWLSLTPLESTTVRLTLLGAICYLFGLIVVHELIHAAAYPGAGLTKDTVVGIWPSHLSFYAAHTGEMTRNRFIAVFLMPLAVITVVPLVYCSLTQAASFLIASVSIVNAFFSCGDLVGAALVWHGAPSSAIVKNQGWQTYWKFADDSE